MGLERNILIPRENSNEIVSKIFYDLNSVDKNNYKGDFYKLYNLD